MTGNHMVQQKINQELRLGGLHALDLGDEFAIEEEALLPCDRVNANEWMVGVDWVFADETAGLTD